MTIVEEVQEKLKCLPEAQQAKVLDFILHLARHDKEDDDEEDRAFYAFSLAQAMRGMEDDPQVYTLADIKAPFKP